MNRFATTACAALLAVSAAAGANEGTPLPESISSAVAHENRPKADVARDAARKPGEVLAFFGIEPGMTVADLQAGGGYYADILCRAVGSEGKVYIQNNAYILDRFGKAIKPALKARLDQPDLQHCAEHEKELDGLGLPEGELDAVLMVLFYHDTYWQKTDRKKMNADILRALKPGGIYGIVDHHAEAGSKDRDVNTTHRVDAEIVKAEILAAGFELVAESDVLSHPEDDRTKNVFAPGVRGQTDRFVYKFKKPVD